MPSSRAVLNDLHENGLNPLKPHVHLHNGRLVPKLAVVEQKLERVVEPLPTLVKTIPVEQSQVVDATSTEPTKVVERKKQKRSKATSAVD